MLRRLLTWVRGSSDRHGSADGRDGGDETSTAGNGAGAGAEGEGDDSEGGFLRSRLDVSVLYAHGQRNARAARTLEETREEADRLEEAREARER
ncbi:MAG: hypothetical protein V5A30_11245 [Haloarculaceae archaeon]